MTYQPVTITVTLSNTVLADAGFVRLADSFVTIPFPYISMDDVKVEPPNTQFRFVNPGVVELTEIWDVNTLPQTVTFTRNTDIEQPAVTYMAGSSIRAADLNASFEQILLKLEELDDSQP